MPWTSECVPIPIPFKKSAARLQIKTGSHTMNSGSAFRGRDFGSRTAHIRHNMTANAWRFTALSTDRHNASTVSPDSA